MGTSEVYDGMLEQLGDFGKYQILQYLLLFPPVFFTAAFTLTYVFTAGAVPHRCLVRECGDTSSSSTFQPPWLHEAIPRDHNGDPSSCFTFKWDNSSYHVLDTCRFDNTTQERCSEWVYKGDEQTILTEFTLTCEENAWRLALVGTINSVGQLLGIPLSSLLSDRYGRKVGLIATLLGSSVLGTARAFSPNYQVFVTFEFLEAIFTAGTYSIAFILAMELVGPRKRVLGGAVIVWAYSLGTAGLGLFAMWLQNWRSLLLVLYVPAFAFLAYIWLLPESVRWLMMRGKMDDARRLIQRAAKMNNVTIDSELQGSLDLWRDAEGTSDEEEGEKTWNALRQVAKSRTLLLRLANCSFCWVTNTLVYYGLSLNSVSLAGTDDIYLNFILVSLVEAPAYIFSWLGMTYLGRRRTLCTALLVSGAACLVSPFLPEHVAWAQLTLYLLGKFAITSSFDTMYVFATEMFPTRLRTSLMGACSTVGRIGSMLAPLTPLLSYVSPLLPMTLFGVVALLAGLLSLFFPETLGHTLPDSVLEAEQLGHKQDAT